MFDIIEFFKDVVDFFWCEQVIIELYDFYICGLYFDYKFIIDNNLGFFVVFEVFQFVLEKVDLVWKEQVDLSEMGVKEKEIKVSFYVLVYSMLKSLILIVNESDDLWNVLGIMGSK